MRLQQTLSLVIVVVLFGLVALTAQGLAFVQGDDQPTEGTPIGGSPVPAGTPIGGWAEWQVETLTDVRSGKTFTLSDFYGKTVIVNAMATWCSSCREQLETLRAFRETEASKGVVFVGISVETDLSEEDLKSYASAEEFDWRFSVASPEVLKMLVDEFGRTLANPPAVPKFVIYPDGTFSDLDTGHRSVDDLAEWIAEEPAE